MPKKKIYTLSEINSKLEMYVKKYEAAKAAGDQNLCHILRSPISHWESKKRQLLEDKDLLDKAYEKERLLELIPHKSFEIANLANLLAETTMAKVNHKAAKNSIWHKDRQTEIELNKKLQKAKLELSLLKRSLKNLRK